MAIYATGNSSEVDKQLGEGLKSLNDKEYTKALNIYSRVLTSKGLATANAPNVHALRATAYSGLNQNIEALEDFVFKVDVEDSNDTSNFHHFCQKIPDNQTLMKSATAVLSQRKFESLRKLFAQELFQRQDTVDCTVLLSEGDSRSPYLRELRCSALSKIQNPAEVFHTLAIKEPQSVHFKTWKTLEEETRK